MSLLFAEGRCCVGAYLRPGHRRRFHRNGPRQYRSAGDRGGVASVERATRFAAQHGIDRVSESYEQLVADPEVDVVYVAAPHSEHRALSLLAISAGKHVLIEKPIAVSATEAEEIAAAARSAGVFAAEAMWTRYLPQFDVLHQVLERGDLGAVRLATADVGWRIGPDAKPRIPRSGARRWRGARHGRLRLLVRSVRHRPSRADPALGSMTSSGVDDQAVVALAGPEIGTHR